ncbi:MULTISPECIES: hypothetical protein [unclassified Pseudonocardia]|uniref:hypothetical protein n=1 Tax=unclassified Pseudonocardia TaxID=2619320 RepID=UPI00094B0B6C|nr:MULTISPECIES: hypothetical protein [unclassified Pseudonocardia]
MLSRGQAVRAGVSPDAVDRRLAARRWVPVHPRVYRDTTYAVTDAGRLRAAVLWAGEDAVLTGAAAAWWWGLIPDAPVTVTVTVPRRRAPRPRPEVQVRRRGLNQADVVHRDRIAVAAPALALIEAALEPHVAGEALLTRVLSGAGTGGARSVPDLATLTAALGRYRGAHGSSAVARMLASATGQAVEHAQHRLRALLVQERVTGWRSEHQIAGVVLRLAFPDARVAVEIRGASSVGDGCGAGWRRAMLRWHGWRVLVLDPSDPVGRPAATLAALGAAVSGRPAGPGGATARRAAG